MQILYLGQVVRLVLPQCELELREAVARDYFLVVFVPRKTRHLIASKQKKFIHVFDYRIDISLLTCELVSTLLMQAPVETFQKRM